MSNQGEGQLGSSRSLTEEKLAAAVIRSAGDALVSSTNDGLIVGWNASAERLFGYGPEEVLGLPVTILVPADRTEEEVDLLSRVSLGETVEQFETVRLRKDSSRVDVSLTISPLRGEENEVLGAVQVIRDVTGIARAREELRISQESYRTLFNSIDEGFCVIEMLYSEEGRANDYRFLEINPVFGDQTGLVNAQGRRMREMAPNHEERWFEIYGQVAETGEPIRFESYSEFLDRWFDLYAFRVGVPEERRVAVIFTNITERRNSEREKEALLRQLESEKSKLNYLFANAPAFVATLVGPEHVFELANPAYYQIVGHREIVGKPIREALPEIAGQGFFELLDQVYSSGEPFNGRELPVDLLREKNGVLEQRFVNFVYQPIFSPDGVVTGIMVHGVDITDQVRARAAAEQANRAKDEFLATLSHELRTPLNAILGWASIIGAGELEAPERAHAVEVIQRNARTQAQLIEDILDVSRIVSGKLKIEVRPMELTDVIDAAVESVTPAAEAKSIQIVKSLDPSVSLILGDPDRLQQVIWNLLSNAIKFTPKGGAVEIGLQRRNSHIEILVRDTGMGIPAKVLPMIFDRFQQADSTTTRQYGGLGLGLAIVRHLVEIHGGTVHAESEEGKGATFTVQLPMLAARAKEDSAGIERPISAPASEVRELTWLRARLEGLRVVVVDDEEDSRNLVATLLRKSGASVTTVDTAALALAAVRSESPDVLVSDIGMPFEDGYSLIKRVRALPVESGGNTPSIALTAFARVEDRDRALSSGFQNHLTKPVEPTQLVEAIAVLCGRG